MKTPLFSVFLFFSLFLSSPKNLPAQQQLSDQAVVSLMTCGPGEEMYSMFGHSALWISDPVQGIDRVYNYGTFDFLDPNFYYYFVRGIADYMLSVTNSRSFLSEYMQENRTVEMQILQLNTEEKNVLFHKLEENYKPENRFYRYDFLFLNCSSVIRDKVFETLTTSYVLDSTAYNQSFRDLLQPFLKNKWIDLGINILLGPGSDRQASNWDRMFLPDLMKQQFELARLANGESLAPEIKTLYLSTGPSESKVQAPTLILFALFFLIGLLTRKKLTQHRWNLGLDSMIFMIYALLGVLLMFMWFFSEHEVVHQNLNLLWAFPLHLILVVLLWIPAAAQITRLYSRVFFFVTLVFFLLAVLGLQEIPTGAFLLAGIGLFRLFRLGFFPAIMNQIQDQQTD